MRNFFSILALTLACTSCVSITPQKFKGPNGQDAYTMKCSGYGRTIEMCYQKAGDLCPSGYNIVNQSSSIVAVPSGNSFLAAPQNNLTIECKEA